MYRGKVTEELKKVYLEYKSKYGLAPDDYDSNNGCEGVEYDDFLLAIKVCLKTGREMCDLNLGNRRIK